jgi:hypothetical protein
MKTELKFLFNDDDEFAENKVHRLTHERDAWLALWKTNEMLAKLIDNEEEQIERYGLDLETIEHIMGEFQHILENNNIDFEYIE